MHLLRVAPARQDPAREACNGACRMQPRIVPAGDRALLVELGEGIDPVVNERVLRLHASVLQAPPPGVEEAVPGYRSLLVLYDPLAVQTEALIADLLQRLDRLHRVPLPPPALVQIPVCYGGEYGPDLAEVAARTGLTPDEVVRLHTAPAYRVYCLGFLPGFAYLGGLDPRLHLPRRSPPRVRVPAGSVGIGGAQTGVYPVASPGGWHLIGRTPAPLYLPGREPPSLLRPGDVVRFHAVDASTYARLSDMAAAGWAPERLPLEGGPA